MVRIGALDMLGSAQPERDLAARRAAAQRSGARRSRESRRSAGVGSSRQPARRATARLSTRAAREFVEAQELNADRPEARLTLGSFYARAGRNAEAEAEYKAALRIAPEFAPASVNLADLYRQTGRDKDGEAVLRTRALGVAQGRRPALCARPRPDPAEAIRGRARRVARGDESRAGERAQRLCLRDRTRFGRAQPGGAAGSRRRPRDSPGEPRDPDGAHPVSQQADDLASALSYAERLLRLTPDDQDLERYVDELRRASGR